MTFGLPIVLNPMFMIPFILTPILTASFAYVMTTIGFCGTMVYAVPWTTPPLLIAWLGSGAVSYTHLDRIEVAKEIIAKGGDKLILPVDSVINNAFAETGDIKVCGEDVPEGYMGCLLYTSCECVGSSSWCRKFKPLSGCNNITNR